MTDEQAAFVKAYAECIASAPEAYVKDFVQRPADKDIEDSIHYTGVMDALFLWNAALTYFKGESAMKKFPLTKAAAFSDRGTDVRAAVDYAHQLATASTDSVATLTAVNVVLNTVINWMDVYVNQPRAADTTTEILASLVRDWMDANCKDMVADWCGDNHDVEDWMNDNAGMTIEHWMNYNAQPKMGEAIEEALEELDLENKIEEVIGNMDLSEHMEAAINDMDLVVRTR